MRALSPTSQVQQVFWRRPPRRKRPTSWLPIAFQCPEAYGQQAAEGEVDSENAMENGAMPSARPITDHQQIRKWAEARGGRPARVKDTADRDGGGVLRFDFGDKDESLQEIDWDTFFDIFEKNNLALLEQEETSSGRTSRFSKFIHRGSA